MSPLMRLLGLWLLCQCLLVQLSAASRLHYRLDLDLSVGTAGHNKTKRRKAATPQAASEVERQPAVATEPDFEGGQVSTTPCERKAVDVETSGHLIERAVLEDLTLGLLTTVEQVMNEHEQSGDTSLNSSLTLTFRTAHLLHDVDVYMLSVHPRMKSFRSARNILYRSLSRVSVPHCCERDSSPILLLQRGWQKRYLMYWPVSLKEDVSDIHEQLERLYAELTAQSFDDFLKRFGKQDDITSLGCLAAAAQPRREQRMGASLTGVDYSRFSAIGFAPFYSFPDEREEILDSLPSHRISSLRERLEDQIIEVLKLRHLLGRKDGDMITGILASPQEKMADGSPNPYAKVFSFPDDAGDESLEARNEVEPYDFFIIGQPMRRKHVQQRYWDTTVAGFWVSSLQRFLREEAAGKKPVLKIHLGELTLRRSWLTQAKSGDGERHCDLPEASQAQAIDEDVYMSSWLTSFFGMVDEASHSEDGMSSVKALIKTLNPFVVAAGLGGIYPSRNSAWLLEPELSRQVQPREWLAWTRLQRSLMDGEPRYRTRLTSKRAVFQVASGANAGPVARLVRALGPGDSLQFEAERDRERWREFWLGKRNAAHVAHLLDTKITEYGNHGSLFTKSIQQVKKDYLDAIKRKEEIDFEQLVLKRDIDKNWVVNEYALSEGRGKLSAEKLRHIEEGQSQEPGRRNAHLFGIVPYCTPSDIMQQFVFRFGGGPMAVLNRSLIDFQNNESLLAAARDAEAVQKAPKKSKPRLSATSSMVSLRAIRQMLIHFLSSRAADRINCGNRYHYGGASFVDDLGNELDLETQTDLRHMADRLYFLRVPLLDNETDTQTSACQPRPLLNVERIIKAESQAPSVWNGDRAPYVQHAYDMLREAIQHAGITHLVGSFPNARVKRSATVSVIQRDSLYDEQLRTLQLALLELQGVPADVAAADYRKFFPVHLQDLPVAGTLEQAQKLGALLRRYEVAYPLGTTKMAIDTEVERLFVVLSTWLATALFRDGVEDHYFLLTQNDSSSAPGPSKRLIWVSLPLKLVSSARYFEVPSDGKERRVFSFTTLSVWIPHTNIAEKFRRRVASEGPMTYDRLVDLFCAEVLVDPEVYPAQDAFNTKMRDIANSIRQCNANSQGTGINCTVVDGGKQNLHTIQLCENMNNLWDSMTIITDDQYVEQRTVDEPRRLFLAEAWLADLTRKALSLECDISSSEDRHSVLDECIDLAYAESFLSSRFREAAKPPISQSMHLSFTHDLFFWSPYDVMQHLEAYAKRIQLSSIAYPQEHRMDSVKKPARALLRKVVRTTCNVFLFLTNKTDSGWAMELKPIHKQLVHAVKKDETAGKLFALVLNGTDDSPCALANKKWRDMNAKEFLTLLLAPSYKFEDSNAPLVTIPDTKASTAAAKQTSNDPVELKKPEALRRLEEKRAKDDIKLHKYMMKEVELKQQEASAARCTLRDAMQSLRSTLGEVSKGPDGTGSTIMVEDIDLPRGSVVENITRRWQARLDELRNGLSDVVDEPENVGPSVQDTASDSLSDPAGSEEGVDAVVQSAAHRSPKLLPLPELLSLQRSLADLADRVQRSSKAINAAKANVSSSLVWLQTLSKALRNARAELEGGLKSVGTAHPGDGRDAQVDRPTENTKKEHNAEKITAEALLEKAKATHGRLSAIGREIVKRRGLVLSQLRAHANEAEEVLDGERRLTDERAKVLKAKTDLLQDLSFNVSTPGWQIGEASASIRDFGIATLAGLSHMVRIFSKAKTLAKERMPTTVNEQLRVLERELSFVHGYDQGFERTVRIERISRWLGSSAPDYKSGCTESLMGQGVIDLLAGVHDLVAHWYQNLTVNHDLAIKHVENIGEFLQYTVLSKLGAKESELGATSNEVHTVDDSAGVISACLWHWCTACSTLMRKRSNLKLDIAHTWARMLDFKEKVQVILDRFNANFEVLPHTAEQGSEIVLLPLLRPALAHNKSRSKADRKSDDSTMQGQMTLRSPVKAWLNNLGFTAPTNHELLAWTDIAERRGRLVNHSGANQSNGSLLAFQSEIVGLEEELGGSEFGAEPFDLMVRDLTRQVNELSEWRTRLSELRVLIDKLVAARKEQQSKPKDYEKRREGKDQSKEATKVEGLVDPYEGRKEHVPTLQLQPEVHLEAKTHPRRKEKKIKQPEQQRQATSDPSRDFLPQRRQAILRAPAAHEGELPRVTATLRDADEAFTRFLGAGIITPQIVQEASDAVRRTRQLFDAAWLYACLKPIADDLSLARKAASSGLVSMSARGFVLLDLANMLGYHVETTTIRQIGDGDLFAALAATPKLRRVAESWLASPGHGMSSMQLFASFEADETVQRIQLDTVESDPQLAAVSILDVLLNKTSDESRKALAWARTYASLFYKIELGGSMRHKVCTALDFDIDLRIMLHRGQIMDSLEETTPFLGSEIDRAILAERMEAAHARMQSVARTSGIPLFLSRQDRDRRKYELRIDGRGSRADKLVNMYDFKEAFQVGMKQGETRFYELEPAFTLPSFAISAKGLDAHKIDLGRTYYTVNDLAHFPEIAAASAIQRSAKFQEELNIEPGVTPGAGGEGNFIKGYMHSPFLVDVGLKVKEPWVGLEDEVDRDELVVSVLDKLHDNVRELIRLAKRWVKERFPDPRESPLNGISITLLCLLYLDRAWTWSENIPSFIWISEAERPTLLRSDTKDSKSSVVEQAHVFDLFFRFLTFVTRESEAWSQCNERNHLLKPWSCAVRWEFVGENRHGEGKTQSDSMSLPYRFQSKPISSLEFAHAPHQLWLIDPGNAFPSLVVGDRLSIPNFPDQEGIVKNIVWQPEPRKESTPSQTQSNLVRSTKAIKAFADLHRVQHVDMVYIAGDGRITEVRLSPDEIDGLPTYLVERGPDGRRGRGKIRRAAPAWPEDGSIVQLVGPRLPRTAAGHLREASDANGEVEVKVLRRGHGPYYRQIIDPSVTATGRVNIRELRKWTPDTAKKAGFERGYLQQKRERNVVPPIFAWKSIYFHALSTMGNMCEGLWLMGGTAKNDIADQQIFQERLTTSVMRVFRNSDITWESTVAVPGSIMKLGEHANAMATYGETIGVAKSHFGILRKVPGHPTELDGMSKVEASIPLPPNHVPRSELPTMNAWHAVAQRIADLDTGGARRTASDLDPFAWNWVILYGKVRQLQRRVAKAKWSLEAEHRLLVEEARAWAADGAEPGQSELTAFARSRVLSFWAARAARGNPSGKCIPAGFGERDAVEERELEAAAKKFESRPRAKEDVAEVYPRFWSRDVVDLDTLRERQARYELEKLRASTPEAGLDSGRANAGSNASATAVQTPAEPLEETWPVMPDFDVGLPSMDSIDIDFLLPENIIPRMLNPPLDPFTTKGSAWGKAHARLRRLDELTSLGTRSLLSEAHVERSLRLHGVGAVAPETVHLYAVAAPERGLSDSRWVFWAHVARLAAGL